MPAFDRSASIARLNFRQEAFGLYDILIVGAGPAGLTAAIYGRRAGKSVLLLEGGSFGGQITLSPRVENYPGFSQISGNDLADRLLSQALALGTETDFRMVTAIDRLGNVFRVTSDDGGVTLAHTVIVAAGVHHRKLGLPNEDALTGSGVSYCAVCDGAFFTGMPVAVVGGGSTALQDALLLADTCQTVHLIHRRSAFRGESQLVDRLKERQNVVFHLNSVVQELLGTPELTGIRCTDAVTGQTETLDVSGLFVAIGQEPQNAVFSHLVQTDEAGYLLTDDHMATATPGLFAAGDCRAKQVRQLTTAVSDGTIAALSACAYLNEQDVIRQAVSHA